MVHGHILAYRSDLDLISTEQSNKCPGIIDSCSRRLGELGNVSNTGVYSLYKSTDVTGGGITKDAHINDRPAPADLIAERAIVCGIPAGPKYPQSEREEGRSSAELCPPLVPSSALMSFRPKEMQPVFKAGITWTGYSSSSCGICRRENKSHTRVHMLIAVYLPNSYCSTPTAG
jgi:hypothetical protein